MDNHRDIIYYDVRFDNSPESNVFRNEPVMNHPKDYLIGINKASIPTHNIPLFFWVENKYYIEFEYNVSKFSVFLVNPNVQISKYPNSIWSIQDYVRSVNMGLIVLYNALITSFPALVPNAPVLTYNPSSTLFSFYIPEEYATNNIFINLSNTITELIQNLDVFDNSPNENTSTLRIINNFVNVSNNYIIVSQDYTSINNFFQIHRIAIESNNISIIRTLKSTTNQTSRPELLSIDVDYKSFVGKSHIIYNNRENIEWGVLIDTIPIFNINLIIRFITKDGNVYEFDITEDDYMSIELIFKKNKEHFLENLNSLFIGI